MRNRQTIRWAVFFLILIVCFAGFDRLAEARLAPYITYSGKFWCNDFEITKRHHPEPVWDRVLFGNSVVISAYREDEGSYINFGLDCGVVTDLWEMLRKEEIEIGSDLVLALNDLALYDDFDTNPSYPWHRKILEPYSYFERDRLRTYLEQDLVPRLMGKEGLQPFDPLQEKITYEGRMTRQELDEKMNSKSYAKYLSLPIEDFDENFAAMDKIVDYCAERGIRLRVVWMPRNPDLETPESMAQVFRRLQNFCGNRNIELHDMYTSMAADCFYDSGHLNYEYGAKIFTEAIEPWLNE